MNRLRLPKLLRGAAIVVAIALAGTAFSACSENRGDKDVVRKAIARTRLMSRKFVYQEHALSGPVTQVKAYIKTIDTGGFNYRPGEQDSAGNWIVHPGEFVVFDLTQRNGAGLICNWTVDPAWTLDDPDGVLRVKETSSPFFLRVIVEHKGHFEMFGEIDGIRSNLLQVTSVANGN